ncbi:hypothetical protein SEPCBS119000_006592 [Sporothrix epigloea]|uniref:F-box domain-containing protein n=1 Tax=Sporothrix epigloea TaxID=1892477 RepID=A0ABP0E3T9_9PEZI
MVVVHSDQSLAPGQDCLSRLPVELLLRIARYLETPDLCAVRLCSRSLERALHHFFMDGFFRSKQFMLTEFSLQTLLDMARHPVISQTLRHVSIVLQEFRLCRRDYPLDTKLAAFLISAVVEQKALMANGLAVQLLAAAFSLLPNLETVQLCDRHSHTPYSGRQLNAWCCHGLRRLQKQLGWSSNTLLKIICSPGFSSRAFAIVMMALAQSNARPPNLEVSSRQLNGLYYFAFDLTPAPRLGLHGSGSSGGDSDMNGKVSALPVLAGLRRLHLQLRFGFLPPDVNNFGDYFNDRGYTYPASVECLSLCAWLAHCSKLGWLRLNMEDEVSVDNNIFLDQLGDPLPDFYPLPAGLEALRDITLPFASHLRRLDLGKACCYQSVLLNLLRRLPALEHLTLWRSSLISVSYSSYPVGTWKGFLRALAEDRLGKQLKRLSLNRLHAVTLSDTDMSMQTMRKITLNGRNSIEYKAGVGVSMVSWQQMVSIDYEREIWETDAVSDSDSEGIIENDTGSDVHDYESEEENEGSDRG